MESDPDLNIPQLRMKNTLSKSLQGKLYKLITWSQKLQIEIRLEMEKKIARQIHTLSGRTVPEEKLRDLVNNPEKMENLIRDQIFVGVHKDISLAANLIMEKLEDIKELEKNVNELCKMINELSVIIQKQTELVNSIDENLKQIKDYLEVGLEKFNEAKDNYNKTQAKLCGICVVLIIVMVIVMNVVMAKVGII